MLGNQKLFFVLIFSSYHHQQSYGASSEEQETGSVKMLKYFREEFSTMKTVDVVVLKRY